MKHFFDAYFVKCNNINEPCKVIIEYGKIQEIEFKNRQVFNHYNFNLDCTFQQEKIYSKTNLIKNKYNYNIYYRNTRNETQNIKIKLNYFNLARYKWVLNKYLIQSDEMKKDFIKYLFGVIGGIIITLLTQLVNQIIKSEPVTEPSEIIKKSLEKIILKNIIK